MKKNIVYFLWALVYCICVGLGFVQDARGFGKILLVLSSLICFVPPFYLAYIARKEKCRKTLSVLRLVSGGILIASVVLIILNFLSLYFSAGTGLVLHVLLVMFTSPMVCSQAWALPLFLYACLLIVSCKKLPS